MLRPLTEPDASASPLGLANRLPRVLRSRRALAWSLRALDLIAITVIYHVAFGLRSGEFGTNLLNSQRWLVVAVLLLGFLYLFETYRIDRHEARWRLPMRILAAVGSVAVVIGVLVYLVGPELLGRDYNVIGRTVLIPSLLIFAGWCSLTRLVARRLIERLAVRVRWLILGRDGGEAVAWLRQQFSRRGSPGELVVLVDHADAQQPADGTWDDLSDRLSERWSGVVVAGWDLPPAVVEVLVRARLAGLRVSDLSEFSEQMWEKLPIHHLNSGWLAMTSGFALLHEPTNAHIKRMSDVLIAGTMLVVLFPVMVLLWILVRLTSSGPGFFHQERVGLNGVVFRCAKFRTMRKDAEQTGAQWAAAKDARVTIIGPFLRRSRMDELPQLWNILRGDMSLIGPRPERPEFTTTLAQQLPYYHLRHLVPPGLTGWAQVNYPYGASVDDAREKLEYDLYYLKNHSLALDLVILLRTVRVVLFGTGAR